MSNNDDPILDHDQILKIARRYGEAEKVTGIEESGGEARGYYIDSDKIIKVQRPHRVRVRTSLEREAFFLNELSSFSEIRVPEVYGYGRENKSIEFTVMSRIPGKAISLIHPRGKKRDELLFDLGKMISSFHTLPDQERLLKSGLFPVDRTREDLVDRLINPLKKYSAMIEQEKIDWNLRLSPGEIIRKVSKSMHYDMKKALHSNPAATHTFADPISHKLTGIIDLGDAYISHPSNDLRRFLSPHDRRELFKGYRSTQNISDSFMSVYIVTQLLTDFLCISEKNEFKKEALEETDTIINEYLL